ncbi:M28 family peptidase [Achromobacter sp.]|uniref:M28 family peptidase n=1 Tax=Achromobacter sp. TaxID=134375 RepID=UPI0028A6B793|nr:M28 family peptidase [Achromobacter sp.]
MTSWQQAAAGDAALMGDFQTICSFGGRLSGTGKDEAAMEWALTRLREIGPDVRRVQVPYDGWRCLSSSLTLLGDKPVDLECVPLLRSASTSAEGLEGVVQDLGAGRPEDFEQAGDAVRGKIVLVRHEYPFSRGHVHRRRKYDMAVAQGAAAFLIANPLPEAGPLSGSSGRPRDGAGIPAAYIGHEAALALTAQPGSRVRLQIQGEEVRDSMACAGILDLPGGRDSRVVISAHMDGHDLGTSALDNATGVAVALAAARNLAGCLGPDTPGLRICFFTAEEWALAGSARYLADMAPSERQKLKININLDTVAGDDTLCALISDYPALAGVVDGATAQAGVPVSHWLPFMPNSDHANFAKHGIPALRLVAGFEKPESRVRHILSRGDVPGIILESEMRNALAVTCAMASLALGMSDRDLDALKAGSTCPGV